MWLIGRRQLRRQRQYSVRIGRTVGCFQTEMRWLGGMLRTIMMTLCVVGKCCWCVCMNTRFYNHSTFIDLILARLLGLQLLPATNTLVVDPILPDGASEWFAVDHLLMGQGQGHNVTVVWDRAGTHWPQIAKASGGAGFSVFVDGVVKHHSPTLQRVEIPLEN
jgi:hypothetical protein